MTIGQRIKERRKYLGLTQEELARRIGNSSRASICTVEKDREDLTTTRIAKLAKALETSPAYLMGWSDDPDFHYENTGNSELDSFTSAVAKVCLEPPALYENENDAFYESLTDEQKAEVSRLYQLYLKADPAHKLAVEALLRETPQESGNQQS